MDKRALKYSLKQKKHALKGGIVYKNDCPYSDDECMEDCPKDKCNKL